MPVRHGSSARFETEKFPANAAAALHRSVARSRDEVRPLDPPIQSPTRLLPHLVLDCDNNRNILLFWNLYASWRGVAVTTAAASIMLASRLNPLWILVGGAFGGLGLL